MKARIDTSDSPSLVPPVVNRLAEVNRCGLYEQTKTARSPAGIYNVSLARVFENLERVVAELESLNAGFAAAGGHPSLATVLDHQERLLYALREHLDDCELVLKSIVRTGKFGRNPDVRGFRGDRSAYQRRISEAVNKIKHENGRLRSISMFERNLYAPGYYVETANPKGVVGPDAHLHDGGHTGWSLFRDVKLHFVQLYLTGAALDRAVASITNVPPGSPKSGGTSALDLARRVRQLPDVVYANELNEPYPRIHLTKIQRGVSMEVAYEPSATPLRTFRRPSVQTQSCGDGFTASFRFPYFWHVKQ